MTLLTTILCLALSGQSAAAAPEFIRLEDGDLRRSGCPNVSVAVVWRASSGAR